jgi:hypothetical protein
MISLEDCVALCGLTEEQILAIAEHEHLPEIATALGQYLLKREHGMEKIRDMIVDDIRRAQKRPGQGAHSDPLACATPFSEIPSRGLSIAASVEPAACDLG